MPAAAPEGEYIDPLQWRFEEASGSKSEARAESWDNDMCSVRLVVMHRPTHQPEREKSGDYPFNWHLNGRKRLWELRLQLRFKRVPQGQLHFAAELGRFVEVSGMMRQAQKALVAACRGAAGECYHSNGDEPSKATPGVEVEPPTFAMPLWAFDQFDVSPPGEEPDLKGDMQGKGMRRSDGASAYISAMKSALSNLSTDRVYTFCLWGISQFVDCVNWEVTGGVLPVNLDFNRLCGSPPVYLSIYELSNSVTETRHLPSLRKNFLRVAAWSALKPPPELVKPAEPYIATNADYCWDGSHDLLGMEFGYNPTPQPVAAAAPAAATQSIDLLGLG